MDFVTNLLLGCEVKDSFDTRDTHVSVRCLDRSEVKAYSGRVKNGFK